MAEITEIKATLKYGKFVFGWRIGLLYAAVIVAFTMPVITAVIAVFYLVGTVTLDKDAVFVLIVQNGFCIFLGVCCLCYLLRHKRVLKQVKEWLKDAVPLTAKVIRTDVLEKSSKPYQIKAVFVCDGKELTRISESGNFFTGYRKEFLRFTGKREILYSRKYDQVLFI